MKRSIMSKSGSAPPSSSTTRPPEIFTPGFGSAGLEKAEKPLAGSSTANRSSRSGRSSQSENRRQRFALMPAPVSSPSRRLDTNRRSGQLPGAAVSSLPLNRFEGCHRLAHRRVETFAAAGEMRGDFGAHARIPEFLQMVGEAGDGRLLVLGHEELADLVGHIDEPRKLHGAAARRRRGADGGRPRSRRFAPLR